jgi:hypothetical protein
LYRWASLDERSGPIQTSELNKAGSYFYATRFKGEGFAIGGGAFGVKAEAGHKKGKESTAHPFGKKEIKDVDIAHLKVQIGPISFGVERTVTDDKPSGEWDLSGGFKDFEASGGRVSLFSVSPCAGKEMCNGFEFGVEAGKVLKGAFPTPDGVEPTQPPGPKE